MHKRIVLTALNTKYVHMNLAVYDLCTYSDNRLNLNTPCISVREFTINHNLDIILRELYLENAYVYAFSCYIWNIREVLSVAKELHKVRPDSYIWLGGPEVSYNSVKVLEDNEYISGVIVGEGEQTFYELSRVWLDIENEEDVDDSVYKDQAYSVIRGITYRTKDGSIITNPARDLIPADDIPFIYNEDNIKGIFDNKILYYETSRGCPFSCSYCLSSIDKTVRFRDFWIVKKEIDFFLRHKVRQVKFVDRTFNCNKKHANDIWNYIADNDNGITNFHFEIAADLIGDEEFGIFKMMRPGLIQLEVGLQSVNPDTIKEIRRSTSVERIADVLCKIKLLNNIHCHLDLIAGLPHEDYESFVNSFNTAYNMKPEQLQLGFLKVLKGSYMEEKAGDYELIYSESQPYEVLSTKWIGYDELLQLKLTEEMVEEYYNSGQYVNTLEYVTGLSDSPYEFYHALGKYYSENGLSDIGFKRENRYNVLKEFCLECFKNMINPGLLTDLLTFDYYLRENAKNRPGWAKKLLISKEAYNTFFKNGGNEYIDLKHDGYDSKTAARSMHIEAISKEAYERLVTDNSRFIEKLKISVTSDLIYSDILICCLFDYEKRDPLTHNAYVRFMLL